MVLLSDFHQILADGYDQCARWGKKAPLVLAGGGIVWRLDATGEPEVCLVHRPRYDDWSWPKGKLEAHESIFHCAAREIQEEIGQPVALGMFLGHTSYPLPDEGKSAGKGTKKSKGRTAKDTNQIKHVFYWSARLLDHSQTAHRSSLFGPVHQADPKEISQIRWVSLDQAKKLLTRSDDRRLLRPFSAALESGLNQASTFVLIRHGKAEDRKTWTGEEAQRPLRPTGAAAAYALGRDLACFDPDYLYSSPWERCKQTMVPYSLSSQLPVTYLDSQTEDAFNADGQKAWQDLLDLLITSNNQGHNAALCMHRPVIGGMLEHLHQLCTSKSLARALPKRNPYMPTGNALVLTLIPGDNGNVRIIDLQKVEPCVY